MMKENKGMTSYRIQLRERIVGTAMAAFIKHGIKAVKMDDIAQELGISKRTLYEVYDNKEMLLFEGIKIFKARKRQEFVLLQKESKNVMDMILRFYQQKVLESKQTNPQFYVDIERYPSVKAYLERDRDNARKNMEIFLKRGVDEGFFRKDIDLQLVARLFYGITQSVMANQLYRSYSIEHIFNNILFVLLRGLCTRKGIDMLDHGLVPRTSEADQ